MRLKLLLSALFVCRPHWPMAVSAEAALPTISNRKLRLGTAGNIVDAHDGCLQKFSERYCLYGTSYGTSDGLNKKQPTKFCRF